MQRARCRMLGERVQRRPSGRRCVSCGRVEDAWRPKSLPALVTRRAETGKALVYGYLRDERAGAVVMRIMREEW